jgi:hypothetical protein
MNSRDRLEAGRSRYDSPIWRRVYDSLVWRWVVGPIAYGALVAAAAVVVLGQSVPGGLGFGALMTIFVIGTSATHDRRRRRADSG